MFYNVTFYIRCQFVHLVFCIDDMGNNPGPLMSTQACSYTLGLTINCTLPSPMAMKTTAITPMVKYIREIIYLSMGRALDLSYLGVRTQGICM